jgi:hypothetical protein
LSAVIAVIVLTFSSCKKENDGPKRTELLVAKTWVYQEYYSNFSTTNVQLLYKRGAAGNSLNLDGDYITFKKDGTFERRDLYGDMKTGTWQYINSETQVKTIEDGVEHVSTTINLNSSNYTWHDVADKSYGIMIPR